VYGSVGESDPAIDFRADKVMAETGRARERLREQSERERKK